MKKKTKVAVWRNNLFLLRQIRLASPGRIPLQLLDVFLKTSTNLIFDIYLLRFIINGLQDGTSLGTIALFMFCVLLFHIVVCIFDNWFHSAFVPVSNQKITHFMQRSIFEKAVTVDYACFEDPKFYDKYIKAAGEASQRAEKILGGLVQAVQCVIMLTTVSFLIFTIDPLLIVFAILPAAVSLIFGRRLNKINYDYQMEMKEGSRKRDYSRRVFYLQDYAKELRMTNINKVVFVRFYEAITGLKQTVKKYGLKIALLDYVLQATNDIAVYLGVIVYAAWKTVIRKTMLLGDCVVIVNSINSVSSSLRGLVNLYLSIQKNALYIEDLKQFFDAPSALSERDGKQSVPSFESLSFRDVTFCYPNQSTDALSRVNFTLRAGEKVALVGLNGAGKTTFLKLLMRLYDPSSGQIDYNGLPLKNLDPVEYRGLFSAVLQDYKLFAFSVKENLLFRDPSSEELLRAEKLLREFGLWDKIADSEGLDSDMTREFNPKGMVLSTGEQQKMAIVRALMNSAPLLVMDEPSSAIDPISESKIFETVLKESKDKTVLFISHRLSATQYADKIYVFDQGCIRESGTHKELLALEGIYANLWNKQAENYRKLEAAQ